MCPSIKYDFQKNFQRIDMKGKIDTFITKLETKQKESNFIFESSYFPQYFKTTITSIKLIPATWRECYDITLQATQNYNPCDAIGLLVPNPDHLVDKLISFCNLEEISNSCFKIERQGLQPFVYEGTLRDFVKYRMDITSIPRKRALFELSKSCLKKDELEFLCSKEGNSSYLNLIKNRNSLLEILQEFGCKPSLDELILFCEILKPRYYSMIQANNEPIRILLGIIADKIESETVHGHVSGFIKNAFESGNSKVSIEVCRRNSQIFQNMTSENLICFCTGTGIAPYIAISKNNKFKNLKLVYGYRNKEDNLQQYFNVMRNYVLAESSNGKRISDFINLISEFGNDCNVFVCGNSGMQRETFNLIKTHYPNLIIDKKVFFDSWI